MRKNRRLRREWSNKLLRKAREGEKGCVFFECIGGKDLECCFQCREFPCKIHCDQEHAVCTRQALDMWKELGETGLAFLEKREELEESSALYNENVQARLSGFARHLLRFEQNLHKDHFGA